MLISVVRSAPECTHSTTVSKMRGNLCKNAASRRLTLSQSLPLVLQSKDRQVKLEVHIMSPATNLNAFYGKLVKPEQGK